MEWEAVDLAAFDRAGRYKLLTGSVIPRPIAWVTTCMPDGRTNLAPYSQFIIISTEPGLLGFSIGGRPDGLKDTLAHLEREGEIVINTTPVGLATVPSIKVKPPRLARSQIQFECRLERLIPLGGSTQVVGHVLLMHIATGLRDDSNHIDRLHYRSLGRIGGRRYVKLTEIIDV